MDIDREAVIKEFVEEIDRENDGTTAEFVVPEILVKKVAGYKEIEQDLTFCKDVIQECLTKDLNPTIRESCLYSIITIYGKCFTDASSNKSPKLEDFDIEGLDFNILHKRIMDLRHNYIAHRGNSNSIINFIYLSVNVSTFDAHFLGKQRKLVALSPSEFEQLINLIDYLLAKVKLKYNKAALKACKGFLSEFKGYYGEFKIAGPKLDN